MRGLHDSAQRQAGEFLRGAGRGRRRRANRHGGRIGGGRQAAPCAAGIYRYRRGSMRLLHARLHHVRQGAARPLEESDSGGDRRGGVRQHLSLHGVREDRRGDRNRRAADGGKELMPWQKPNTPSWAQAFREWVVSSGSPAPAFSASISCFRTRSAAAYFEANTPTRRSSASTPAKPKRLPASARW